MMMTMMMMMMLQVLTAEICTPTYTTSCGPVSVKGTKLGEREQCVQIRSGGIIIYSGLCKFYFAAGQFV